MSQSGKNEVDLLLRALARDVREGVRERTVGDGVESHLDADELNAFAENVLPSATRARYMSHLADCDECRSQVSQLAQAAGLTHEPISEVPRSSFWSYISAFFSPVVLRYAVPALALVAVASIGLLVYRNQAEREYVAQRTNSETPAAATLAEPEQAPAAATSEGATDDTAAETKPAAKSEPSKTVRDDESTGPAKTTSDVAEDRREKGGTSEAVGVAGAAPSVTYAPEPKAASPQPPTSNAPVAQTQADRARGQRAEQEEDFKRDESKASKETITGRAVSPLPVSRRASGELPQKNETTLAKDKQAKASSDVKTIAGRKFQHDGDKWVDTDFDGRATVVVRRGSEQYRALVSDEPKLKTIADSLEGTVIVVWKGRAYRFQ